MRFLRQYACAVLADQDLELDRIVLVRLGTVPKTTSGKTQRQACRELYLAGDLEPLGQWLAADPAANSCAYVPPRNPLEAQLAAAWAEVLGVDRVGIFDSFLELGGSSLMATQLVSRLAPRLGIDIPLSELFDRPTVAALAELVSQKQAARQAADAALLEYLNGLSDEDAAQMLSRNEATGTLRQIMFSPGLDLHDLAPNDLMQAGTSDARATRFTAIDGSDPELAP